MRTIQISVRSLFVTVCSCVVLQAQMPAQPQMSFTEGSSGTWNADWNGVTKRTYFVQYSLDLVNWSYAPLLRYGTGIQSCGIQTENADKFFVRLKYMDDPALRSLAQARAADFDGDGIPNAIEVEFATASDPFDVNSVGSDTDSDGMPDSWEYAYGLDSNSDTDGSGDLDDDGLTNLQEYQALTKPDYYDTDTDGFSDGFELGRPGYDPLVFNVGGDQDSDGLSDTDELTYGTSLAEPDTDFDGFTDLYEVENGSDPLDALRNPFAPSHFFGNTITDANAEPMGDLGVLNYSNGDTYEVEAFIADDIGHYLSGLGHTTNEESWRINIGSDISVTTIPYRVPGGGDWFTAAYSNLQFLQLDGRRTYEAKVEHLGLARANLNGDFGTPDFNHRWYLSSKDFLFLTNDPNRPASTYTSGSKSISGTSTGYNWNTHTSYLVPIARLSYSTSYTGGDATGPRFRKISHFGRPVPDVKPEGESETDEAAEESYVDAFDLSLHYDTSFASIPLAASDLRLEASASVRETTWSSRNGLRPAEEITSPFGISWSSNLCAYIETVESFGSSTTRPTTVSVIDEGGRSQRFGTADNMQTFFPWPSSATDKKTYLNELTKVGNDLVLQKKFGNKLKYSPCDAWFMYSSDRLESSPTVMRHRYWRLVEVEDRYGVKVQYNYGANPYSLIPVEINAIGRPDQKLTIARSLNGRRINSITDAEGNVTQFHYTDQTLAIPSTILEYPYQELSKVTFPDGSEENYTYEVVSDSETLANKVTHHLHANLKSIQRDGYAQKVFTYEFDRTKKWYDQTLGRIAISASLSALPTDIANRAKAHVTTINKNSHPESALRTQYGLPRSISKIEWPTLNIESSFAKAAGTQTTFGPVFSSTNGTDVTDAEGKKYTYTFGGTHGEIIDTNSNQVGGTSSVSTQWLIYHDSTTLEYKNAAGTVLGSENFEFDPDSGLSLERTVDFSGNETLWNFENTRPAGSRITPENNADFLANWADPTKKTDAIGRIENYEYGNLRMLSKLTDVHGSITVYTVDSIGRRTMMTVTSALGALLQKETYEYGDTNFPGFLTRKTRKAFLNLSGKPWEQDLVVEYEPDALGRVWKEKVDPSGENLITIHTYDLNNQKLTSTDARSLLTTFEYDSRNRLNKAIYADNSFKEFGYDDNSNKVKETDENGNSTLIERNGLGRITATARDMNDDGIITSGDLITKFGYSELGLLRKKIDPRGFSTVTFYDDLHRPQHMFSGIPEASADDTLSALTILATSSRQVSHQEYSYDVLKNTGGGLLSQFKPTGVIRHNAVSMERGQPDASLTDSALFDEVYRPTESNSEYAPGFSKTTLFDYGTVSGLGRASLVTTFTDALGKVTQTTRDALGREIQVIDGFGNTDPNLVLTVTNHFTSTGLLWRSVDPLLRHTETEFDSVGRPVKSFLQSHFPRKIE